MLSHQITPRFRTLSVVPSLRKDSSPLLSSPSVFFDEKDREKYRDPEKECFMCLQSNIYMKPIGMQHEKRVTRRNPPPLTRAQIDELSQRKSLSKREARLLLLCFFPEIKHVKHFQLHRYHSCCYDPKHLKLCKNHITALENERRLHPHPQHPHHQDQIDSMNSDDDQGARHRVSFIRIKIEPHKGIPTRFLGPAALPESLVNMLIKQVHRFEEKKMGATFDSTNEKNVQSQFTNNTYVNGDSGLSEFLSTLPPNEDSDDEEESRMSFDGGNSNIHGYRGVISRPYGFQYPPAPPSLVSSPEKPSKRKPHSGSYSDGVDPSQNYFRSQKNVGLLPKIKKPKKHRRKKRAESHEKPKLFHWEVKALEQAQQEPCGCRHHVRRMEADQIIYGWCRCKDHQHQNLRIKEKAKEPVKIKKVENKTVGVGTIPTDSTEIAIAYDPKDIDYDVIKETIYYRTTSGRLVKPEITNSYPINEIPRTRVKQIKEPLARKPDATIRTIFEQPESIERSSSSNPAVHRLTKGTITLLTTDRQHFGAGPTGTTMIFSNSTDDTPMPIGTSSQTGKIDGDLSDEQSDDDDDNQSFKNFEAPKYISASGSPVDQMGLNGPLPSQRSTKPVYKNENPTPNFERESSIMASRRWFDQPLGDENLQPFHDGRYGLIAGVTTQQYEANQKFADNDYADPLPNRNRSDCKVS